MGYGRLVCSQKWLSDMSKLRGMPADPRCTSVCMAVNKTLHEWVKTAGVLASLPVSKLFHGVGYAIIPHLKEDHQGYLLIRKSGP